MSRWIERMAHMSHRTPSDPASQPEHNRTMLERVRQNVRRLVNQATPCHIHANPFGKALDKPDDIVDELTRNSIRLNPLIKRHVIDGFEGVPGGFRLGWAQLPQTHGHAFSIGLFTDSDHFAQIALADGKARVFAGTDPDMDTQELEPRFVFVKEETLTLADGPRLGHAASRNPKTVRATQGGVVGRMPGGRMMWLASWLKTGNRYTLEQMRANLPANMRFDLEYRDAITIAFFAAYMLPQMNGLLVASVPATFSAGSTAKRP